MHFSRPVTHALLVGVLSLSFLGILYYFLAEDSQPEPMPMTAASVASPVEENMLVYVAGAVEQPGVYRLPLGSRVKDAVQAAGNLLPYADAEAVNLAAKLRDGEQISVPFNFNPPEGQLGIRYVNINTANLAELTTLPGVGEATAQKILDYRREHGLFRQLTDLEEVKGIGEGKFKELRRHITI